MDFKKALEFRDCADTILSITKVRTKPGEPTTFKFIKNQYKDDGNT